MTSAHIIFIPGALMIGMFLGFVLGARAARNSYDLERKREAEREQVRAERAERKAKQTESKKVEKA